MSKDTLFKVITGLGTEGKNLAGPGIPSTEFGLINQIS